MSLRVCSQLGAASLGLEGRGGRGGPHAALSGRLRYQSAVFTAPHTRDGMEQTSSLPPPCIGKRRPRGHPDLLSLASVQS